MWGISSGEEDGALTEARMRRNGPSFRSGGAAWACLLLLGGLASPVPAAPPPGTAAAEDQAAEAFGWLGIRIGEVGEELADDLAQRFGPAAGLGVLVVEILKGGPAEASQLRRGDVVVELNGQAIWDVRQLQRAIRASPIGSRADLTVLRGRERAHVRAPVGAMPEEAAASIAGERFGLLVQEVEPQEIGPFRLRDGERIMVALVEAGSLAARAGVQVRDVILRVDGAPVASLQEFRQRIRSAGARGRSLDLLVRRDGEPLRLTLGQKGSRP